MSHMQRQSLRRKEIFTMADVINNKNFVGYEYKEVWTSRDLEGVYADGLANFGWQLDGGGYGRLKFKRDRKIRNKAELERLQRRFESGVAEIESLERSKSSVATTAALTSRISGNRASRRRNIRVYLWQYDTADDNPRVAWFYRLGLVVSAVR
jgi:hypothetical protein